MRRVLLLGLLGLLWSAGARAQEEVPAPPPRVFPAEPGKPKPFDPDQTREAQPHAPIEVPRPEVTAPRAPTQALDVLQAVKLAWELQPDVRVARARLVQAEGLTDQQRVFILPQLRLESNYSHLSTTTVPTVTDQYSNGLVLRQLLFDFGHTRDLILQADRRRRAAAALVLQSENDAASFVKERFYGLQQRQRLLRVAEDDLGNRQAQLRLARALYQAGNRSPGDVVRAQTAVSNSVFTLNNARRDLEIARQQLAQTMGLPPLTPLTVLDESEPDLANKDVRYVLGQAQRQRPDILAAQENVRASEAGLQAAATTSRPAFQTQVGVNYQGAPNGPQVPAFTLGVGMAFNVYDGGAQAAAVRIARGVLEEDQANLSATQLAAEAEVVAAGVSVLTAERNLEATRAAVDSALEGIRIADGRYRAALGTLTDIFDAQTALVTAQQTNVFSQTALDLARAQLRHALAAPFGEGY